MIFSMKSKFVPQTTIPNRHLAFQKVFLFMTEMEQLNTMIIGLNFIMPKAFFIDVFASSSEGNANLSLFT